MTATGRRRFRFVHGNSHIPRRERNNKKCQINAKNCLQRRRDGVDPGVRRADELPVHCERSEAIQRHGTPPWIASSLCSSR